MVSALTSGSSDTFFNLWPGHCMCYVLRQETLLSQCLFLPRCINAWGNPAMY